MRYFYDTEFLDNGVTVDLISIGIVAEDGREYYAVNKDADWDAITKHEWLQANVVNQLPPKNEWLSKEMIKWEVEDFLLGGKTLPELWADFAAYDHIVLSQLFGKMLDLPRGIPMFTNDLRTFIYRNRGNREYLAQLPLQNSGLHDALEDARHLKNQWKATFNENGTEKFPFTGRTI